LRAADDILYITDHNLETVVPLKAEDILFVYIEGNYSFHKGVIILYTIEGNLFREPLKFSTDLSEVIDPDTDMFFRNQGFTVYTEQGFNEPDLRIGYICFVNMDKILYCGFKKIVMIGAYRRTVSIFQYDRLLFWKISRDWKIKKRNQLRPLRRDGVKIGLEP